MKMKWKSALLALFIGGFTLSSCSDKGDVIDPDLVTPVEEGDAFFSFDMSMANKLLMTKATEIGDAAEQAVQDGMMVLYDPTSKVCKYVFELDVENGSSSFTGTDVFSSPDISSFRTVAQRVDKQDYLLLIVLNPTTAMKDAVAKNKYYSEFEDAKTTTASEMKGAIESGIYKFIPMTNASGLVEVEESQLHTSKESAENATNLPKVQVDRILTKVFFKIDNGLTVVNGDFQNASWQLDITNKKTYWVRRLTNIAPATNSNGDGHNSIDAGRTNWEHETDYPTIFREYVYAEDPNWDNISIDRGTTGDLTSEFDFLAAGSTSTGFLNTLTTTADDGTREYALENTMAPEDQWEDVTTRALVRANFVPTHPNIALGNSYYFYGGKAFTYTQLENMYNDLSNNNNAFPWPDAPSGLKEVVVEAVSQGFFGGTQNVMADRTQSGETSDGQLGYYANGISYYAVKIRHFDDNLSSNEPEVDDNNPNFMNFGRYGVVRNNVYKLTLKTVNGPGKPTIPDPEGPDDKKQSWLSVDIEVLPWVIRTQNVDL